MCPNLEVKTPERRSFGDFAEAATQRCSVNKVFLEISQNSRENTCAKLSFLIKFQASGLHRCFPVNFAKLLKTAILQIICERLLMTSVIKEV